MPSPLTRQLEQQYQHINRHHARERILERWADDPHLAGRTPAALIDLLERQTLEQNPVIATLLRRHQTGDPDAATILLTAMRPMLKCVVVHRHGAGMTDELMDNYWSAASHLIGAIDPTIRPIGRNGRPALFLSYLGDRLVAHLRQLDPEARRWHDRRKQGRLPIPVDLTPRPGSPLETSSRQTVRSVEDTVLARLELEHVAAAVGDGQIAADRWQQLLQHRLGVSPTPRPARERVAVHRTAHRLAEIVGHAA